MGTAATPEPEAARPAADAAPAERRDRTIAAVSALLLAIGMPIGWFSGGDESTGDVIGFFVIVAVVLALMAWIVLRLVPGQRAGTPERATRAALILGIVAFVLIVVFWTALPFAVGAGAVALGLSLRDRPGAESERTKATVAAALGAFAILASFVVLLIG